MSSTDCRPSGSRWSETPDFFLTTPSGPSALVIWPRPPCRCAVTSIATPTIVALSCASRVSSPPRANKAQRERRWLRSRPWIPTIRWREKRRGAWPSSTKRKAPWWPPPLVGSACWPTTSTIRRRARISAGCNRKRRSRRPIPSKPWPRRKGSRPLAIACCARLVAGPPPPSTWRAIRR